MASAWKDSGGPDSLDSIILSGFTFSQLSEDSAMTPDSNLSGVDQIGVDSGPLNDSSSVPDELAGLWGRIESYRLANHPGTAVSFWAESSVHGAVFSNEDEQWSYASAIKVFILIAAYLEFKDVWDEVPGELSSILNHEDGFREPLQMFSPSDRAVIQDRLWNMSYGELAVGMMGSTQNTIGNSAYNAACNVLISLLGGPGEGCTGRIIAIVPGFSSVRIGRYMLESRTTGNDNTCSMRSLALACRLLSSNSVPGLEASGHEELRSCFQRFTYSGYRNYQKHGHLSTAPGVNSWIGWIEADGDTLIYGVNVLRPDGASLNDEGADYYRDMIRETLVWLRASSSQGSTAL